MGATLLAGRFFDSKSAYDRGLIDAMTAMQNGPPAPGQRPSMPKKVPVLVTRAMLPMLGVDTPQAAIGQQIAMQPNFPYLFDIVGVVEDWNQRPLKYAVHPIIFVPQNANQAIAEIPKDQVADLQDSLTRQWGQMIGLTKNANVILSPLETLLQRTYESDFRLMRAVTSFAIVAMIVAGLGVFGLSAFEMRRRVQEIGIRKALGASPVNVALMVIGRAVMFAAIATLIAWPIAFWIANEWLQRFVYRTTLGAFMLPLASLAIVAFVALAVSLNATRAAAVRPSFALRTA
jgi:putative ABC transport system permease protein